MKQSTAHQSSTSFNLRTICSLLAVIIGCVESIGPGRQRYPSYPENSLCVLSNAARWDPKNYMQLYGVSGKKLGCDVPASSQPIYLDTKLEDAAVAHAFDMAKMKCFDHNTCDPQLCQQYGSCETFKRIRYYFHGDFCGENIGTGDAYKDPRYLVMDWLNSPGHCSNLLNPAYNRVGHGTQQGADAFKAVQDLGIVTSEKVSNTIVCAGHVPFDSKLKIIAAISQLPSGSKVFAIVNGKSAEMKCELGNGQNSCQYGAVVTNFDTSKCNSYSVEVRSSSNQLQDRYPDNGDGSYLTEQFGKCVAYFDPKLNLGNSTSAIVPKSALLSVEAAGDVPITDMIQEAKEYDNEFPDPVVTTQSQDVGEAGSSMPVVLGVSIIGGLAFVAGVFLIIAKMWPKTVVAEVTEVQVGPAAAGRKMTFTMAQGAGPGPVAANGEQGMLEQV